MKGKTLLPKSTIFKSVLANEQLMTNLDALKMHNYSQFIKITQVGKQISTHIKNEDVESLRKCVDDNLMLIPFLKLYIDEGFLDALHLRYVDIVEYLLQNGFQIQNNCDQALITVCYSLEYLKDDPPTRLLQLLLQYKAPLNACQQQKCRTAIHFAAKYGCPEFVRLLIEYGADFDAVDNNKKTPLNYAKSAEVIQLLKNVNAKDTWKY